MKEERSAVKLLLALLDGAGYANAIRRCGKPCPIRLPDDPIERAALVHAHLCGTPAALTFHANGCTPWEEQVESVILAALCPANDGRCRWVGIDLDSADHGASGLADPVHATRALAERADASGLAAGVLVARSRRSRGRHLFLMPPEPVALTDAVIGVAALAAAAFRIAASDLAEYGAPHAFRRTNGVIARLGDAGAVELLPRSTVKPPYGWALTLPGAGAYAPHGGGVIVDPYSDKPINQEFIPRCHKAPWCNFIKEAKAALSRRDGIPPPQGKKPLHKSRSKPTDPIERIDPRTRQFLSGDVQQGGRNASAFAASINLLGCGVTEREAEQLILGGAVACGLPQREAAAAFKSAVSVFSRKQGRS